MHAVGGAVVAAVAAHFRTNDLAGKLRPGPRIHDAQDRQDEEGDEYGKAYHREQGKEGHTDFANREKYQELLRFNSSRHSNAEDLISLKQYVDEAPPEQKSIYYLLGPSRESLDRDPRLELFRKKGVEVLYLYDLADEFVLGNLGTYEEQSIVSADQVSLTDLEELRGAEKENEG